VTGASPGDRAHQALVGTLDSACVDGFETVGVAEDHSWAEACVAIVGLERPPALELGRRFGQLAILEWTERGLAVLASAGVRSEVQGWRIIELSKRPCPVPGNDDPMNQRCKAAGGPYGSRAIDASAAWHWRRDGLLRVLGCDVCGGGKPEGSQGKGIYIDPAPRPSRVGVTHARPPRPSRFTDER
jgi:hypothetical protein